MCSSHIVAVTEDKAFSEATALVHGMQQDVEMIDVHTNIQRPRQADSNHIGDVLFAAH